MNRSRRLDIFQTNLANKSFKSGNWFNSHTNTSDLLKGTRAKNFQTLFSDLFSGSLDSLA